MVDPPADDAAEPRPRGRRARGQDTRRAIVDAARTEFLEHGYSAASMRAVARRAGVDPALVRYWFPQGRSALFAATLTDTGIDPGRIAASVASGPVETMGPRLVAAILAAWERPDAQETMALLLRTIATGLDVPAAIRDYLMREVFARVRPAVSGPDADLRINLAMSHVVGLMVARYLVRLEPLASAPAAQVVAEVGPVLQRYFTPDACPDACPDAVPDDAPDG
ncbi:MAG: TetR/AcrR family transcriptional regulator [Actinomycetales bacterium]|nr:TetR/AcrR family transcriptional regulator [Actinomycetales bacterium]